ncbi:MAG: hypothetical protein HZC25_00940 [Rhodospirillales bacterium]|nr:hypothetical protein [Rhodospirillales bacterium]
MSETAIQKKASKVELAMKRLDGAVARLDKAAQRQAAQAEDKRKLDAEMAALRAAALSVSAKLDGAIGRLRGVLEE